MQQASRTDTGTAMSIGGLDEIRGWVARLEAELDRVRSSPEGRHKGTLQILLERELARKRGALQVVPALRIVR